MKIAISGSTGFIGKQLSDFFSRSGNELIVISRSDFAAGSNQLAKVINSADVIINLAGAPVLQRWTKSNKQQILSSRVETTQLLVDAVRKNLPEHGPRIFINSSAIGIYRNNGIHDEQSTALGNDFLATVCKAWEGATDPLREMDLRLCISRFGIVLGTKGGSLQKMLPLFKAGIGGKIGSGKQPFAFIHVEDLCRAIDHLIMNDTCSGIYNMVSPDLVTNDEFTVALAESLHRPALFSVPEFALKIIYGEAAEVLIKGAFVKPVHLLQEGFVFQFPDITSALTDLVQKR